MPLIELPNELFHLIAKYLSPRALNLLCQTNRRLNTVIAPLLHKLMIQEKNTLLMWAAKRGNVPMAKLLLKNDADINFWRLRSTPLIGAVSYGQEDMVRFLLEKGASVGPVGGSGMAPLHYAVITEMKPMVKLLIEKGCDVNIKRDTEDEMTALHYASQKIDTEIASILLDAGASVASTDSRGRIPLHLTASRGNQFQATASLLLEKGSDINAADLDGNTPLFVAASKACAPMVKLLLSKGASAASRDEHQNTALHVIANSPSAIGGVSIIGLLVESGIDIDARDHHGNTALHDAAFNMYNHIVSELLKHGANTEALNESGKTPLGRIAKMHNCKGSRLLSTIQALLENGANIEALDDDDRKALNLTLSMVEAPSCSRT